MFQVQTYYLVGGGRKWRQLRSSIDEAEEEQDREEGIKGMKHNSRGGVRSTCLGSHSKEVCQDLLI